MVKIKLITIIATVFLVFSFPVYGDIFEDEKLVNDKIRNFVEGTEKIIIVGEYATQTERLALKVIKDTNDEVKNIPILEEKDNPYESLGSYLYFLLGGPKQNKISEKVLSLEGSTIEKDEVSAGYIYYVTTSDGRKFIIMSDKAGFENLPKAGVYNSPLANFMPIIYVPLAATGIGLFLIWLGHFLLQFFNKVFRSWASGKIMKKVKKKELKEEFTGFSFKEIRIKLREWIAIIFAALVFAMGFALNYTPTIQELLNLFYGFAIVNVIIYIIRHFTRLVMDRRHKLHTEYVFWWWGAIASILTGWFGNTFSLAGYMIKAKDAETEKEGEIQFTINILTFLLAVIALVWNFISPHQILQTIMIFALATAFIQMLPFSPFSGKNIYRWKKVGWWFAFIIMMVFYVGVNLIV